MFAISLNTIFNLLLMAIPGFILAKAKLIDKDKAVNILSILLLYVCTPFIMLNAFLNKNFDKTVFLNLLAIFVFTTIFLSFISFLSKLLFKKAKIENDKKGVLIFGSSYGNVGFMCIPFLATLMPGNIELILYATTSLVPFNLITWTLGCYQITSNKRFISFRKAFFNPPTLAFIIILPLFLFNLNFIKYPSLNNFANTCKLFAEMVGPLSMTILGIKFADFKIKDFKDKYLYFSSGIKLIISPILAFLLVLLMSTFMDMSILSINIIALTAMPTANNING